MKNYRDGKKERQGKGRKVLIPDVAPPNDEDLVLQKIRKQPKATKS